MLSEHLCSAGIIQHKLRHQAVIGLRLKVIASRAEFRAPLIPLPMVSKEKKKASAVAGHFLFIDLAPYSEGAGAEGTPTSDFR